MPPKTRREARIDEEVEESFPASDPPAFTAGALGAPKKRSTPKPAKRVPAKPVKKKTAKKKSAKTRKRR